MSKNTRISILTPNSSIIVGHWYSPGITSVQDVDDASKYTDLIDAKMLDF